MRALRHYLSHFCGCDDEAIARHVAAEEAGQSLPLPDLASWAQSNPLAAQEAARSLELVSQQRAASLAPPKATTSVARALETPARSKVLGPKATTRISPDERRRAILTHHAAGLRPALAASLAADETVSFQWATRILPEAPVEISLAELPSPPEPTHAASGFGSVFEDGPKTAAEKSAADVEQFKAIARAVPVGGGGRTIRMHV